jgi:hypothetical protein
MLDDGQSRIQWADGLTAEDVFALLVNPFYAINIAPMLAEPHEPLMSEDKWVAANVKLIENEGAEAYLRTLLSVLKGNYR